MDPTAFERFMEDLREVPMAKKLSAETRAALRALGTASVTYGDMAVWDEPYLGSRWTQNDTAFRSPPPVSPEPPIAPVTHRRRMRKAGEV